MEEGGDDECEESCTSKHKQHGAKDEAEALRRHLGLHPQCEADQLTETKYPKRLNPWIMMVHQLPHHNITASLTPMCSDVETGWKPTNGICIERIVPSE